MFREKFTTSDNVLDVNLFDWKSNDTQAGLELKTAYLDIEGNGSLWWPDDDSSSYYKKYAYI